MEHVSNWQGQRCAQVKIRMLVLALLFLLVPSVLAATFSFNPDPFGSQYNLSERSSFTWDLNATVNESLLRFTRQQSNLSNLDINNQTGIINFTPEPRDIGYHSEGVIFIAENITNSLDFITTKIFFNVTNVNDAPNITSQQPPNDTVSMVENSTLIFNITADDEDLIQGDAINVSWYINGGMVLTNLSSVALNSSLNFTAGFCNASSYNITVRVHDLGNLSIQRSWALTVNNTNRPPQLNVTIANRTWDEDTNLTNNLTLRLFFYDPDSEECSGVNQDNLSFTTNLTFGVGGNTNINITIERNSSNVSFYPVPDFAGNESVLFSANDSYNITQSNVVLLSVLNVPDAPVMVALSNQTATVNVSFSYLVYAVDPDLIYGDSLTWGTNSTIFNITKINSTHALINFTPTIAQIGNYSVYVNVTDSFSLTDIGIFDIRVQNNTAPVLNPIGPWNATQGTLFSLNVSGSDGDNDSITFTSNSSFFTISAFNATLGTLSFTPTNAQVGNHSVLFIATDSRGAQATETILFGIANINDAPSIDPISSPQSVKVNHTLVINVTADDPDLPWGDSLNFSDNTTIFNISTITSQFGLINYSPAQADVGNHSILINVTDRAGLSATTFFLLVVTNSSPPALDVIGNYTAPENTFLSITINATDIDGDTLNFTINSTLLNTTNFTFVRNVTATRARFSGTPDQEDVGLHIFRVNVTDPDGNYDTRVFSINVTYVDDTPILPLVLNQSVNEDQQFLLNLSAYDEELVRFGIVLNLTFYTNSSLFNLSERINATAMLINFTPTSSQVGNYSINITVSDGVSNTSQVVYFEVVNINDPPTFAGVTPESPVSVAENGTVDFAFNASDPDLPVGDYVSAAWYLDGTNQTSLINTTLNSTNMTSTWRFQPSFCLSGVRNVTVVITDRNGTSNRTYWNVTVSNVDRSPEFGIKRQTNAIDFLNGTHTNTSAANSSGNITLFLNNATLYDGFGTFVSEPFDMGTKFRFSADLNVTHIKSLDWDAVLPANTSIELSYRTSLDGVSYTNWSSNLSTTSIPFEQHTVRFLQWQAFLYADATQAQSPTLTEVRVLYTISNITINQNTRYSNLIDLNDYFLDPDTAECSGSNRDNLTLGVIGNSSILTSLSSSVVTLLEVASFEGQDDVFFTANDTFNETIGDKVVFTVVATPGTSIPSTTSSSSSGGGGGGGSSTITQTRTQVKNVTKPLALNILVPKPLIIYENESVSIPIGLINDENFTLRDIYLRAEVPNSTIIGQFTVNYLPLLEKGGRANTTLIIRSFRSLGTYEVIVKANVSDPPYLATASFFVSSIELGTANDSQFNTRITFARDLLNENPDCLELTEQLARAQVLVGKGDAEGAEALLTQTIEDCRYLLTQKNANIDQPGQPLSSRLRRLARNPIVWFVAGLLLLSGVGFGLFKLFSGSGMPNRKLSAEEEEIAAILGLHKKGK